MDGAIFDEEMDAFDAREVADDFGESPGDRGKFAGPVGEFVGPAEPGGVVGFPFGGHMKAEGVGRFCLRDLFHLGKESNTRHASEEKS